MYFKNRQIHVYTTDHAQHKEMMLQTKTYTSFSSHDQLLKVIKSKSRHDFPKRKPKTPTTPIHNSFILFMVLSTLSQLVHLLTAFFFKHLKNKLSWAPPSPSFLSSFFLAFTSALVSIYCIYFVFIGSITICSLYVFVVFYDFIIVHL